MQKRSNISKTKCFNPVLFCLPINMNMKFKYFQTTENFNKHISMVVKYSNATFHCILMTNCLGVTRGKHTSRYIHLQEGKVLSLHRLTRSPV